MVTSPLALAEAGDFPALSASILREAQPTSPPSGRRRMPRPAEGGGTKSGLGRAAINSGTSTSVKPGQKVLDNSDCDPVVSLLEVRNLWRRSLGHRNRPQRSRGRRTISA